MLARGGAARSLSLQTTSAPEGADQKAKPKHWRASQAIFGLESAPMLGVDAVVQAAGQNRFQNRTKYDAPFNPNCTES
jgi:hypothetical protein